MKKLPDTGAISKGGQEEARGGHELPEESAGNKDLGLMAFRNGWTIPLEIWQIHIYRT
jgi:hypothetical protein